MPEECLGNGTRCATDRRCYDAIARESFQFFATQEAALDWLADAPEPRPDALLVMQGELPLPPRPDASGELLSSFQYTIRLNHSDTADTNFIMSPWDPIPNKRYQQNWFLVNLQLAVDRALISETLQLQRGSSIGEPRPEALPVTIQAAVKPFPWPPVVFDAGSAIAAGLFSLLLVFAFLLPSRAMVSTIVHERELQLREGMRILGLKDSVYWASWALTHMLKLCASGFLCAIVSRYPFNHSSMLLLMLFFFLTAASLVGFSYFLSAFFDQSKVASSLMPLVYIIGIIPGFVAMAKQPYGSFWWVAACLLPPSALHLFCHCLLTLESSTIGIRWSTLWAPVTAGYPFSVGTVFTMLFLDVFLYAALTWYFDQIMPRQFGQQKPLWFLFTASYWLGNWRGSEPAAASDASCEAAAVSMPASCGEAVAVLIRGLRKVFFATNGSKKVAVAGLDLDIYNGQVMALLGQNGAGKTTTISILTGMLEATAGSAHVGEWSVRDSMDRIRDSLGVCPQFDILWPELTVREHLTLYAAIKGYRGAAATQQAEKAVAQVGLEERMDGLAGELSGGQRRKLSVAIAFLGAPRVVFLDEPTSGMDPRSKRFTWDVIRRNTNANCAIVLTTHSMWEADALADRIAIMADGELIAVGSSMDLKMTYGTGYTLTIVHKHSQRSGNGVGSGIGRSSAPVPPYAAQEDAGPEAHAAAGSLPGWLLSLRRVVQEHVPDAVLLSAAGAEVVFQLPHGRRTSFPALLRRLDRDTDELGVMSYGLSETTLEDVFLRISQDRAGDGPTTRSLSDHLPQEEEDLPGSDGAPLLPPADDGPQWSHTMAPVSITSRLSGSAARFASQMWGLLVKRALHVRRERLALLVQVLVPLLMVVIAMWLAQYSTSLAIPQPLQLSRSTCLAGRPAMLGAAADLRHDGGSFPELLDVLGDCVRDGGSTAVARGPAYVRPPASTMDGYLLDHWRSGHPAYDGLFLEALPAAHEFAAGTAPVKVAVLANETAVHAIPASVNTVTSALLRWALQLQLQQQNPGLRAGTAPSAAEVRRRLLASGSPALPDGIQVRSWPLPLRPDEQQAAGEQLMGELTLAVYMTLAVVVLSASFVVFLVAERTSGSKHVQMVCGANPAAFWLSNVVFDAAMFAVVAAGMLACVLWWQLPQFQWGPRLAALTALLAALGAAALPQTYLLHYLFSDGILALRRISSTNMIAGVLGFCLITILRTLVDQLFVTKLKSTYRWTKVLLRSFSPHFCFASGVDIIYRSYKGTRLPAESPFTDEMHAILVSLLLQGLVYSGLVYLVEVALLPWLWWRLQLAFRRRAALPRGAAASSRNGWARLAAEDGDGSGGGMGMAVDPEEAGLAAFEISRSASAAAAAASSEEGDWVEDEDVAQARLAAAAAGAEDAAVLMRDVSKTYIQGWRHPPVRAVRNVSLAVPGGECFGLLGTNGAGKTTCFRMLTGETWPDSGTVGVAGCSVANQLIAARSRMGYCPQLQGLPQRMTGREVLTMFARLRGVAAKQIADVVQQLLTQLGLAGIADDVCRHYSGGNRRRLSVAVALIGSPAVVFLDEPSTGLDPAARRLLWNVIQGQVVGRGATAVLSSHSMEECEALCTKLSIMQLGRFRCLGTVQHLKSRFGGGYSLELHLPSESFAMAQADLRRLCPSMALSFKEHTQSDRLVVYVGQPKPDIPGLLQALLDREDAWQLQNYTILQGSLERVFLHLTGGVPDSGGEVE